MSIIYIIKYGNIQPKISRTKNFVVCQFCDKFSWRGCSVLGIIVNFQLRCYTNNRSLHAHMIETEMVNRDKCVIFANCKH